MDARPARWRTVRIVVGIFLAALTLYALSSRVDSATLWAAFRQADAVWVAGGVLSVLLTLTLVTVRWHWLVEERVVEPRTRDAIRSGRKAGSRGEWRALWDSVVIGQAVNIVFPLRFGEGARVAVTCGELGLPLGSVVVAVALERVLDVAAFGTAVLLLLAAGRMPAAFRHVGPSVLILAMATTVFTLLIVKVLPLALHWLRRRVPRPSRVGRWFEGQEQSVRSGWANIVDRGNLLVLIGLTAMILVSSASTNFLIFRAFALPVPPIASLVLLAVLQVGTAIVSVPGNIGVFHYLTVTTLAVWFVSQPTALAAAIVLHVVSLGPRVVLGAISGAGLRFRRLRVARPDGSRS